MTFSRTSLTLAAIAVVALGSTSWLAARAQQAPPVSAPAESPQNYGGGLQAAPDRVVVERMVDGKRVLEERLGITDAAAAPALEQGAPPAPGVPVGVTIAPVPVAAPSADVLLGDQPPPVIAPLPPNQFNYFISAPGGPHRRQLDEAAEKLLQAERELAAKVAKATAECKVADEAQRGPAEDELRQVVAQQFDVRQQLREKQLDELEQRLVKLRELHDKRQDQKDRIIGDRIQQILRDVEGLGWGDATPGDQMFFFHADKGPTGKSMTIGAAPPAPADVLQPAMAAPVQAARPVSITIDQDKKLLIYDHSPETMKVAEELMHGSINATEAQGRIDAAHKKAMEAAASKWKVEAVSGEAKLISTDGGQLIISKDGKQLRTGVWNSDQVKHQVKQAELQADEARLRAEETRREAEEARMEAHRDAEEARVEAEREVEEARLEAMHEALEAREDLKAAAEEAHREVEEAAREAAQDAADAAAEHAEEHH